MEEINVGEPGIGENLRYGRRRRTPNSLNVPFSLLLEDKTGKFKPLNELSSIFSKKILHLTEQF